MSKALAGDDSTGVRIPTRQSWHQWPLLKTWDRGTGLATAPGESTSAQQLDGCRSEELGADVLAPARLMEATVSLGTAAQPSSHHSHDDASAEENLPAARPLERFGAWLGRGGDARPRGCRGARPALLLETAGSEGIIRFLLWLRIPGADGQERPCPGRRAGARGTEQRTDGAGAGDTGSPGGDGVLCRGRGAAVSGPGYRGIGYRVIGVPGC